MHFLLYASFSAYTKYMTRRRTKTATAAKAYKPDPICAGKRFFHSEQTALEAADQQMLDHMDLSIGVYQCPSCRLWHLTRIKP